ncbi:MAG: hypothetical protein ACTHOK_12015 [Nocardioidaceae bacterium]
MRRYARRALVATAAVAAFMAPASVSYALWSVSATGTVTVTTAGLAAPSIKCVNWKSSNSYTISWSAVSGATSYGISRATTNTDGSFTEVATSTSASAAAPVPSDGTYYVRVKAKTSSASSAFSNTLQLTRSGTGNGNITCKATP